MKHISGDVRCHINKYDQNFLENFQNVEEISVHKNNQFQAQWFFDIRQLPKLKTYKMLHYGFATTSLFSDVYSQSLENLTI